MRPIIQASLIALALGPAAAPPAMADPPWASQHAEQHARWDDRPHTVHKHDRNSRTEIITAVLNDRFRDDVLPLRRLLGLGPRYNGYRIDKVVVRTAPRGGRQDIALVGDGLTLDREPVLHRETVILKPRNRTILGETVDRLQLAIDGRVKIRSIDIHLKPQNRAARPGNRDTDPAEARDFDRLADALAAEIARILVGRARTGL